MSNPWRDAWNHAQHLLRVLRGRPESRQVEGLIKALEKMRGDSAVSR